MFICRKSEYTKSKHFPDGCKICLNGFEDGCNTLHGAFVESFVNGTFLQCLEWGGSSCFTLHIIYKMHSFSSHSRWCEIASVRILMNYACFALNKLASAIISHFNITKTFRTWEHGVAWGPSVLAYTKVLRVYY